MNSDRIKNGVLACSIGGTNTHCQVYHFNGRLVDDWIVPTTGYPTLLELLVDCGEQSRQRLGAQPDVAGLLFAGPVEQPSGRVVLTNVPQFADEEVTRVDTEMALGMPTIHDNDVAGAAVRLTQLHELGLTMLTEHSRLDAEGSAPHSKRLLIEIGTGVGTALHLQYGGNPQHVQTFSCEIQHAESKLTGESHETNLCGSRGFERLVRTIKASNLAVPVYVQAALEGGKDLGPIVTQTMTEQPEHPFTQAMLSEYGARLGEYLRLVQLAFQPHAIFFGGSVGRAANFLDRVVRERTFWHQFLGAGLKHNVQVNQRENMPLVRIENPDLTVQGARDLAVFHLLGC